MIIYFYNIFSMHIYFNLFLLKEHDKKNLTNNFLIHKCDLLYQQK